MKIDYLIVGQGLAGSLLAWKLLERGKRILVADRDEENTSSKVAAGLVTPLTGSRFTFDETMPERLRAAKQCYWDLEEATGERLFHHVKIARLFRDEEEQRTWKRRIEEAPPGFDVFHAPLEIDGNRHRAPHGGFEMREGGWLDMPRFLEAVRQVLLERAAYAIAKVDSNEVEPVKEGVRWKNVTASKIVFAQGWRGNRNRFFDWLPMRPAAGDILDLSIPGMEGERRILNRGGWILPLGEDRFRAGSTYRYDFEDEHSSERGLGDVVEKVRVTTPCDFTVLAQRSAVRPIIRRSQVFGGTHPGQESVVLFNGFGSKGVLNGPWHADRLVDHLVDGAPLPPAMDLRSNLL